MVPQAAVGFFRRRLSAAGTPERATTEKAYLKSDLRFYGATSADVLLPRWAAHESFWVRRTALLAQHDVLKAGEGNFALFARLASDMLEEREFFVRKAIGWVLREVSKKRPALVYGFLRSRLTRLSGLTLREGSKYLSDAQRRALGLAPRRDSRGASHARGQGARVGSRSASR